MPQGRRKIPFSAKQKKLQLQNKRKRKGKVDGKSTLVQETRIFLPEIEIIHFFYQLVTVKRREMSKKLTSNRKEVVD